jgi:hypothetical protein
VRKGLAARGREVAPVLGPVLGGEDEGGEPQVREDDVERQEVAAVVAPEGEEESWDPGGDGQDGLNVIGLARRFRGVFFAKRRKHSR